MNNLNDNTLPVDDTNQLEARGNKLNRLLDSIRQFTTVAEVMRIFGAILMIASMSLLLLKGWHQGDDILRYLKLLAMTGLLAAGGFSLSYLLQEQKGARLFFSLGLISVPANFGILGALIYSLAPDAGLVPNYPDFARWVVSDVSSVMMVSLGALSVLLPVTVLGFRIIARNSARLLTFTYIGLNALLLLPFRGSLLIGVMLSAALIVPAMVIRVSLARDVSLLSVRGRYALSILFIPTILLLTRNLYLYQLDYFLGVMFLASLYSVCRQWSLSETTGKRMRHILELISAPLAYGVALCSANLLDSSVSGLLFTASFSAILGAYLIDFQLRANKSLYKSLIVIMTASTITVTMIVTILILDTAGAAITSTLFGIGLMVFGVYARSQVTMIIGLVLTTFAVWFGLDEVISLLLSGDWLALAIMGAVVIVSASLLDRYGVAIRYRLSNRFDRRNDSVATVEAEMP